MECERVRHKVAPMVARPLAKTKTSRCEGIAMTRQLFSDPGGSMQSLNVVVGVCS